jgi:hypothetical protein
MPVPHDGAHPISVRCQIPRAGIDAIEVAILNDHAGAALTRDPHVVLAAQEQQLLVGPIAHVDRHRGVSRHVLHHVVERALHGAEVRGPVIVDGQGGHRGSRRGPWWHAACAGPGGSRDSGHQPVECQRHVDRALMREFYDQLARHTGRAEALRQAKRQLMSKPRHAHPHSRAAFIAAFRIAVTGPGPDSMADHTLAAVPDRKRRARHDAVPDTTLCQTRRCARHDAAARLSCPSVTQRCRWPSLQHCRALLRCSGSAPDSGAPVWQASPNAASCRECLPARVSSRTGAHGPFLRSTRSWWRRVEIAVVNPMEGA